MHSKPNSSLINLILLVIIEVMGIGIIFPMLPKLFILKDSILIENSMPNSIRHLYYGLSIGLWPLGMFFGTPYWGEVSDKIGRKKIFILCLTMTAVSYGLSGIAIYLRSIWLFLFSRLFSGFFAGCYEIAHAAAADISTPENKARNMGWIVLSLGIGFTVGPLITTFFTIESFSSGFGITAPFGCACSLSLINALTIFLTFRETFQPDRKHQIDLTKIFSSFLYIFIDKRLTYLSIVFFCLVSAWTAFFTGLPLFLSALFHLNTTGIGFFYCLIGLSNIITMLFVQPYILKHFSLKKIVIYSAFFCSLFLVVMIIVPLLPAVSIFMVVFTLIELLTYSSFLAVYSNAVTPKEQGKAMGGSASVSSAATLASTMGAVQLANFGTRLPIILSVFLFFLISILMIKYKPKTI